MAADIPVTEEDFTKHLNVTFADNPTEITQIMKNHETVPEIDESECVISSKETGKAWYIDVRMKLFSSSEKEEIKLFMHYSLGYDHKQTVAHFHEIMPGANIFTPETHGMIPILLDALLSTPENVKKAIHGLTAGTVYQNAPIGVLGTYLSNPASSTALLALEPENVDPAVTRNTLIFGYQRKLKG